MRTKMMVLHVDVFRTGSKLVRLRHL
jgi:hypothetical protein